MQPYWALLMSMVQGFPSSHGFTPLQTPATQVSPTVFESPSSQVVALLFACWQVPEEQVSSVHGFLSSQSASFVQSQTFVPATHEPPEQWSPVVHGVPSSQTALVAL